MLRAADLSAWPELFVCCSGSFRLDRALKERYPAKPVLGNDVSLVSCAIGALLTGAPIDIRFHGRLQFMEDHGLPDYESRVAAVLVALALSAFSKSNDYSRAHFEHVVTDFGAKLAKAREKVLQLKAGPALDGFYAGDFRDHAQRALERNAGIFGFMPTYKGRYELMYRFMHENVAWQPPSFRTWDPKDMPAWLDDRARPARATSSSAIRRCLECARRRSTAARPTSPSTATSARAGLHSAGR